MSGIITVKRGGSGVGKVKSEKTFIVYGEPVMSVPFVENTLHAA